MAQVTLNPTADCQISGNNLTTNYGSNGGLYVGESTLTATSIYRALIQFDLSSLAGAVIQSVKLRMRIVDEYSDNARNVYIYRLLREWVEAEATWNIAKTGTNWGTAGAANTTSDYNSTALGVVSVPASPSVGDWIEWDLTAAEIEKLIDGTYSNFGFLIRSATENNDLKRYSSREGADPPQLVVTYTPRFVPQAIWI